MEEAKYYVTIDNRTVAENMTLEFALMVTESIFNRYYDEREMVVAIERMPVNARR